MASSAAAAAMSSGAGASGTAANGPSLAAGNKSHFKPNATVPTVAKAMDGGRRQSGSPIDGPQRRPSQKAWTQGTNPITQRNINNSLPNGAPHQARNTAKGSLAPQHDLLSADRHADDRLLYLLANCIGRPATITAKTGESYAGIFSCSSSETTDAFWLLKMVKRKAAGSDRRPGGTDGASSGYVGSGPEHSMYFDLKDVVDLAIDGVDFGDRPTKGPNGIAPTKSFRTDNDISGNQTVRERTLQRWEPSAEDDPGFALEDGNDGRGGPAGSNGAWDQFEANKRLYGITSDYDVNLYTTAIDRSDPQYKDHLARAEKIAREIEASNAMNAHVAEERGLAPAVDDGGMDEEAKYSEVRRTSKTAEQPVPMSSQDGMAHRYTPPARQAPAAASSTTPAPLHDPAIVSQRARQDPALPHAAEAKGRNGPAQAKPMPAARDERNLAPPAGATVRPRALPAASKAAPAAATAKQPTPSQGTVANNLTSPRTKAPGESATTTVEHDVRDAFKHFANTEKMRWQEHRRNQAKHDKDIKLNDLMKFSQNFKLTTPVPKDLVPILAKDKNKQEEIVQRAQRNVESNRVIPGSGSKPIAAGADAKGHAKPSPAPAATATSTTKTTTTTTTTSAGAPTNRPEVGARLTQSTMPDRQPLGRGRAGQSGHGAVGGHQGRPPPPPPNAAIPPARAGPGLSQRLNNFQQQQTRGPAAQMHVPPPLPIHDHRGPPAGPAGGMSEPHRYSGAPTPTSATSSRFNVSAMEFKPAAMTFPLTAEPSAASSPQSNVNAATPSRAPTPSGFFGAKKPLPASERRPILDHFNPLSRLRREAEQNKEEWPSNGGIRPAHKTGPRWEVAETNREKTYAEMFEKVPFSTQSVSPQHPPYAAPHLPHQHQLPFHLQHVGPVVPQPPTAHQVPHHMHPQQQHHQHQHQHHQQQHQHQHQHQQHQHQQHQQHQHHHHHPHPHHPHHPAGMPHHFDEHRMHVSSSPSVLPSPRLQPVHMTYQSPMGQHAQIVYGQPVPQYGMAPTGPPMAPLRQYPAGSHFVPQHGAHVAPMMTHSPSGGHMAAGIPQGVGAPYGQPMPVYSPNPVHAYMHPGGPPPPQPGSSGYPSPGRAAPMMIHQGSQPGQPPHQMMMFGMSPGPQSQHLYVSHPPMQGPGPRGGNYPPPQQPHYAAMPPAHHMPAHHRGGPSYGHQPPPPPHVAHVAIQPGPSGPGHGGGHDDEDLK